MPTPIQEKTTALLALLEAAENPKISWKEMEAVAQKAFKIQDEVTDELDALEQAETDIRQVQEVFTVRELVWDVMEKINAREQEVHTKTHKKPQVCEEDDCGCEEEACPCKKK